MAEVTITRTLFRTGDSEYAINGAACRLLDIQELLSDTGVGRQQHMIIGQGQLDTVLNARPEDRRAIIEDAAGVRKHRQRRERAERRLESTQENLERLGDLVREVRRQIRPLERQATAARSHGSLAAELRELRQHLAGVELAELAERGRMTTASLSALRDEQDRLLGTLAELDREASAAAAELASRREEDLAASLGRVRALLERTRGTTQVLEERRRALAAALDAAADVDVVSTLEAEAARLASETAMTDAELRSGGPEVDALARAESELAADVQAHIAQWGDDADVAAVEEALEVTRARVEVLRRTGQQAQAGLRSLERRIEGLGARDRELEAALHDAEALRRALAERGSELEDAARAADGAAGAARTEADDAERALAAAEQERHRSAARAEALARALQELQGSGGREVLSGDEGVVGALVELVEIDPGFEAAFEAAVGASMAAVVVEGRRAAKNALGRLRSQGTAGAVLPAPEGGALAAGIPEVPRRRRAAAPPRADAGRGRCAGRGARRGPRVGGRGRGVGAGHRPGARPPRARGGDLRGRPLRAERMAGPLLEAARDGVGRGRGRGAGRAGRGGRRSGGRAPRIVSGEARGVADRRTEGDARARPPSGRGLRRRGRAQPDRQRPGASGHRARRRASHP